VIFNPTKDALRLDDLTVELSGHDRLRFPRIPAEEVSRRITGFKAPQGIKPAKLPKPISSIIDQEFLVKMVPPGDTIGGFLYFDRFPETERGTVQLYLHGLRWASSGKEL